MPVENEEPSSPTVTYHDRIAAAFLRRIEQAFALIGELQSPHPKKERFVRANHTVPPEFIGGVAAIVEEMPELAALKRLDPQEARDVLQFVTAFKPAATRVAILLGSLRFTMRARKAKVADQALQVYLATKRYAHSGENGALAERAATMRRILGRARRRRETSATT